LRIDIHVKQLKFKILNHEDASMSLNDALNPGGSIPVRIKWSRGKKEAKT